VVPFKVNHSVVSKAGRTDPNRVVAFANGTTFTNGTTAISGTGYGTPNSYNYNNFVNSRPMPYKFPTPKYEPGFIERLVMCQCRGCDNSGNDSNDVSGESKPFVDLDVTSLMAPWGKPEPVSIHIHPDTSNVAISSGYAGSDQYQYDLIRPTVPAEHNMSPPLSTPSTPTSSPKRKAKAKAKGKAKADSSSFGLSTGPAGNTARSEAGSAVTGSAFKAALAQSASAPALPTAHNTFGTSRPGPEGSYLYSPLAQGDQGTHTPYYQEDALPLQMGGAYPGDFVAQDLSSSYGYSPIQRHDSGGSRNDWYSEASSGMASREHSWAQNDPSKVHVL
jgi:hypothetical protein